MLIKKSRFFSALVSISDLVKNGHWKNFAAKKLCLKILSGGGGGELGWPGYVFPEGEVSVLLLNTPLINWLHFLRQRCFPVFSVTKI